MNSPIVTSSARSLGSTSDYTVLGPMGAEAIPFGPTYKLSSSWRKFIHTSTQRPASQAAVTFVILFRIGTERTTTERSIVLKSTPTPRDPLSGPLFQVAGMFAIGEPGWADKHDEYLAETYLENHADSK